MLAAVLYPNGKLKLENREIPTPKEGEVLVKVKCCGICMTDVHIAKGRFPVNKPIVLGHEFSGIVHDYGEHVGGVQKGDHVVINPLRSCGGCQYCQKGMPNLCQNALSLGGAAKTIIDGGFQEYAIVPKENIGHLSPESSFEAGAMVEPLGCAIHGINKLKVANEEHLLIIGAGPMGLILLQLAQLRGVAKIIVSEPMKTRRALAKQFGADVTHNPAEGKIVENLKTREFLNQGVDLAIEASGNQKAVESAISSLKRGGRVLIFGVPPKDADVPVNIFHTYFHELTLRGSYALTNQSFHQALALINSKRLEIDSLISHKLSIRDISKALKLQEEGRGLKKMITFI